MRLIAYLNFIRREFTATAHFLWSAIVNKALLFVLELKVHYYYYYYNYLLIENITIKPQLLNSRSECARNCNTDTIYNVQWVMITLCSFIRCTQVSLHQAQHVSQAPLSWTLSLTHKTISQVLTQLQSSNIALTSGNPDTSNKAKVALLPDSWQATRHNTIYKYTNPYICSQTTAQLYYNGMDRWTATTTLSDLIATISRSICSHKSTNCCKQN